MHPEVLVIKEDGKLNEYVTKVVRNGYTSTIALNAFKKKSECNVILAGKSNVEHVLKHSGRPNAIVEVMPQHIAFQESMKVSPICRCFEESDTAKKTGIKPWHHCKFIGDKVYCWVWDTRTLELIIDVATISPADFIYVYTDNQLPLNYDEAKFSEADFDLLLNPVQTIIDTIAIQWP